MRVAWVKGGGIISLLGILGVVGYFATQSTFPSKSKSHEVQSELSKFSQTLQTSSRSSKYLVTESDRSVLKKHGLLKGAESSALNSLLQ